MRVQVNRPSLSTLAAAAAASATSVPMTVIAVMMALVAASSLDDLDGYAVIGVMILAQETWDTLLRASVRIGATSFGLFPVAAILTQGRSWLRAALLLSLGPAVGTMIASHDKMPSAAVWLSALAGLIAGGVFALVGRDD
ncbi:hypothetical protein [Methylorubrum populi]|jgi:hypothetical protein|uniref:hypothetical protein n=2 Tax=Methylorubrum populi TaxID=223967 RepID=UPI00015D30FC|nr:hypothetical protein [Methylorubrum populi]